MALITFILLYGSLITELTVNHVPSVANTSVFFSKDSNLASQYKTYRYIFKWPTFKKVILLVVPHLLNVSIFFVPWFLLFSVESSFFLTLVGAILAVIGRSLTIYAMVSITKNNSQKDDDFYLHTNGIFAKSRNPGLLGMFLFFLGIYTITFHWLNFIPLIAYFLYNHFRVLIEEDYLTVKFQSKYTDYLSGTPRYL